MRLAVASLFAAADARSPSAHTHSRGVVGAAITAVNYTWDASHRHADYVHSGEYVVENNAITGIKLYAATIFLTVPRWRPGVPSTLNTLVPAPVGARHLLAPYPSWEMQALDNCSALQYVQSMEIDPDRGEMWVVDVGRRNFLDAPFSPSINRCPPKLVILSLPHGSVADSYDFPDAVASHDSSFLNDIVVDVRRQIAFISDAGTGALVAFNRASRSSHKFADATTKNDPTYAFTINGVSYGNDTFTTPADGIALLPDGSRVVYCALQGADLWSVDAAILADPHSSPESIAATEVYLGRKAAASDGLAFDCTGTLFFGGLTTSALYSWPFSLGADVRDASVVEAENVTLHWIDTFAFDEAGNIFMTSNRLDTYFARTMDFRDELNPNFRVVHFHVGTKSYLQACEEASYKQEIR